MLQQLLNAATARMPLILADIEQLVTAQSPTADAAAIDASARGLLALVSERVGPGADLVRVAGCPHVVMRLGPGPRQLILVGHHDTVWPMGTLDRLPFTCAHGVLRGPGAFDMKAGLVMAIHAIALLGEAQGTRALDGVTLLITGDEEVGSPSSRQLIEDEARTCRAALVLEASGPRGALKTERKGVGQYHVNVTGRAAHAGLEPENGVNAGLELAHQIQTITGLGDQELGTTVTPTRLSGGTTTNTVPAEATVAVDVRAWSAAELKRVHAALHALAPVLDGAVITVAGGVNRPPLERAQSAALFARAVALGAALGVGPISSAAVGGASDGNFTAGLGIPTLDGLGAVGGGAHADTEHVLVDQVPGRTALLAALILDQLTTGHGAGGMS